MVLILLQTVLIGTAAVAVWCDLRERRIPNRLTIPACVAALGLRALLGWDPLTAGLLGLGAGFLVALPIFALGGLGGGDVKLVAAVGAFVGPSALVPTLLVAAIAGGLLALAFAVRERALGATLDNTGRLMNTLLSGHAPKRTLDTPGALAIPYALPIALGAMVGCAAAF